MWKPLASPRRSSRSELSEVSETFFAVVERIYSFFSASTHRWKVLLKYVPNVAKRVIDTRWSAHYKAVKALHQCFVDVVGALNELGVKMKTLILGDKRVESWMRFSVFSLFLFYNFVWKS